MQAQQVLLTTLPGAIRQLHRLRPGIFDEHIGFFDQLEENLLAFIGFQIDGDAFFVAVEIGEKPGPESLQPTRVVPLAGALDLD
jgi:hypothetical protein